MKSKVTRLTGRVAKVREEIKRYLDDDSDKPAASRVAKSRLQAFLDQTQGALNTFG